MKYLLLFFLCGCVTNQVTVRVKTLADKIQDCTERFIRIGVLPEKSLEICKEAYKEGF